MNKKKSLIFFLVYILLVNCSFDTKTGIWTGDQVVKKKAAQNKVAKKKVVKKKIVVRKSASKKRTRKG